MYFPMIWLSESSLLITNYHQRMIINITTVNIEYWRHKLTKIIYVLKLVQQNINVLLAVKFKRVDND